MLRLLLITYVVWCTGLFFMQRRVLFPGAGVPAGPAPNVPGAIRVDVTHEAGVSEGWLLLGEGVSAEAPGPVVFFCHGNGETVDGYLDFMVPRGETPPVTGWRRLGVSVALLEYRGFGRSGGAPSQAALEADLLEFSALVRARAEVDGARTLAHGRSLGGGVVGALLESGPEQVRGVVLESTFRNVTSMTWRFGVPPILVRDPFPTERRLAQFEGPSLMLHGNEDQVIPFKHGVALSEAARDGVFLERRCGHNDCPWDEIYWRAVGALKARAVGG